MFFLFFCIFLLSCEMHQQITVQALPSNENTSSHRRQDCVARFKSKYN